MDKKDRSFWKNPFGGAFDFNRDGKEDVAEQWVGFKIFKECTKEEKNTDYSFDNSSFNFGNDTDTSWREFCEDGSEFDVDPGDYETEDEYNEALEEVKYAWRDTCEDASKYGLDPNDYETEDEYNEALKEEKYGWRALYQGCNTYGLDPNDFETLGEFRKAQQAKLEGRDEEQLQKWSEERRAMYRDALEDETIYTYCGVLFPFSLRPYSYRTKDATIKINDKVIVPAGDKETEGTVVSVGHYKRIAVPFPVEKTKFIISKLPKSGE